MSLFSVPDLVLLTIFDQLPLKQLLNSQIVCRRWYALVPAACLRRRSLALVNDHPLKPSDNSYLNWFMNHNVSKSSIDDQLNSYLTITSSSNFNFLSLPNSITQKVSTKISNLFCNLTCFSVTIRGSITSLEAVIFILNNQRIQDNLKHLTIKFALQNSTIPFFSEFCETDNSERFKMVYCWLFAATDNLQSLQRLSLDLDVHTEVDHKLPLQYIPLHFLNRQLEHFHFASTSSQLIHHLINTMLGVGVLPKNISLSTNSTLSSLLSYPQKVAQWFSKLNLLVTNFHDELSHFVRVREIFSNLTNVTLGVVTICQFNCVALPQLTKLPFLNQLTLNIVDNHTNVPLSHSPLPVLTAVSVLRLTVSLSTHEHMTALQLPTVYPNLLVIAFDYFTHRCTICAPEGVQNNMKLYDNCEQLARTYLQQCPNLKTVL